MTSGARPEEMPDLRGKTILYLVTEDWYFWSHRLPFARAARDAGATVIVACRFTDHRDRILAEGFTVRDIPFDRSGLNPIRDMKTYQAIAALYRQERPDLVHHVAMKPVLYGGLAAANTKVSAVVNAMAGLGFLFIAKGLKITLLRPVVECAFGWLNNRKNTHLIVQNGDDAALFETRMHVKPDRIVVIRGSGVDIDRFYPTPEPPGTPVAVCVSRMLWDKGIGELVEAARLLKQRGVDITIRLVGPTDANPASIPAADLKAWQDEGVVEVAGPSSDIPGIYGSAHIAVLPSYREGLPKSLLEGAACARPVIATDVPGCREICRDGETGLRVQLKSVTPLADALQKLAEDPALRRQLGKGARHAVETDFAESIVVAETMALYKKALGLGGSENGA
ncbi:MAG: glycosyltransferase family 4 protein [Alphaproteobacteria bacterium]|nr:glycosyltransferase family 4 protein [Alphaproteobacteria bacterium]